MSICPNFLSIFEKDLYSHLFAKLPMKDNLSLSLTCSAQRTHFLKTLSLYPEFSHFLNHIIEHSSIEELAKSFSQLTLSNHPISLEIKSSCNKPLELFQHIFPSTNKLTYLCEYAPSQTSTTRNRIEWVRQACMTVLFTPYSIFTSMVSTGHQIGYSDAFMNGFISSIKLHEDWEISSLHRDFTDKKLNSIIKNSPNCNQLCIKFDDKFQRPDSKTTFFPTINFSDNIKQLTVSGKCQVVYLHSFQNLSFEEIHFHHPWLRDRPDCNSTIDSGIAFLCFEKIPSLPNLPKTVKILSIQGCSEEQLKQLLAECPELHSLSLLAPEEKILLSLDQDQGVQIKNLTIKDSPSLSLFNLFSAFPNLASLEITANEAEQLKLETLLMESKRIETMTFRANDEINEDLLETIKASYPNARVRTSNTPDDDDISFD